MKLHAILISISLPLAAFGAEKAKPSPKAAPKPADPPLGVYHWPIGTAGVDAFATWLGRDTVWALDFVGGESWDNVGWPVFWLDAWSKWVKEKPGRRLVLSIPLLAGPPDGSGPVKGSKLPRIPVSFELGVAGHYDEFFRDLAQNLARYKMTGTILRPGWEFNGGWYAWKAKGKTKHFIEFWRRIVKLMREQPGAADLKFCWCPTLGDQDFPADEAWPGDDVVDFVGVDVYDETWNADTYPWPAGASRDEIERRRQKVWREWIMDSPRGLAFWTKFAKKHGKPLAIPEWGVVRADHGHGGLDNAHFIEQMHRFITDPANNVAFHCYFDINERDHRHELSPGVFNTGKTEGTEFSEAAAKFRALFGTAK